MGSLQNVEIKTGYVRLLQVPGGVVATPAAVEDGDGTATTLLLGTTSVQVSSTPSAANDVIRKGDLDAATWDASDIVSGTLAEARMPSGYRDATKIHGRPVTSTAPSNNQVYVYSTGSAQWELQTLGSTLSGDVTGTTSSAQVVRLQGRDLASTAPTLNQVIAWNGSSWTPANPATGSAEQLKLASGTAIDATLRAIADSNVSPNSAALQIALNQVLAKPASNNTATFEVQQADATPILTVDTTNARAVLAALRLSGAGVGVVQTNANGDVSSAALTTSELPEIDDTVHGDRGGDTLHAAATDSVAGFMPAAAHAKLGLYPDIIGLTGGQVLRATGAATTAFDAIQKSDLPTLTPADVGAAADTHASTHHTGGTDALAAADIGAAAATHASTHHTGGSDELTSADIGAAPATDATITSSAAAAVALTVRGETSQSAAVLEIYDEAGGTKIAQLLPDGTLEVKRVQIVETFS